MSELMVRPMHLDDVPEAEALSSEAFLRVDQEHQRPGEPDPSPRSPARSSQWVRRGQHFLQTDPGGSWVAEEDGRMVGFAVSYRRDLLWLLASYAVRPGQQGRGVGAALLEAALTHSRGCLRGMLAASSDPRAVRRYRLAGFDLHPQMTLSGVVDRSVLPVVEHVRTGTPADVDLLDSLDRRLRHAGHGRDHELLTDFFHLLVVDRPDGSGYAYVDEQGQVVLLAATDRRTASRLLWQGLALTPSGVRISLGHVTAANAWALDVGLAARLEVGTEGYLALRGMNPPAPYLHHGAFL